MVGQPCYEREKIIQLFENNLPFLYKKEEKELLKIMSSNHLKWLNHLKEIAKKYEEIYFIDIDI